MRVTRAGKGPGGAEVTAVIPCYNYGHFLPQAVNSVLDQSGVRTRVVIVDDCSTDDSLEVAKGLARADSRVTVIAHAVNEGHIKTYNDGLDQVRTEYLTLLSADDLLAPGALGRATALMGAHPRVGLVYGQPVEFSDSPPTVLRDGRAPLTWTIWRGRAWIRIACMRGRNFILSPEVVMRTAAVAQIGGYNSGLPKSGDLEYWLRTASRWDIGRVNGRVQAYYRQHRANMHATTLSTVAEDLEHRLMAFEYLLGPDFARASPKGARYFAAARAALGREALLLAIRELDAGGSGALAAEFRVTAREAQGGASGGSGMRRLERRLRRAESGAEPSIAQRSLEAGRCWSERIRWRIWVYTGLS